MRTGRLAEMIDWYTAVIGGECTFRANEVAWMTNDAANHRIAFLAAPTIVDDDDRRHHSGMHHTAFEYDSFDDLMASWKRLDEHGISPSFSLDDGLICLSAPSARQLRLRTSSVRPFGTALSM